MVLSKLWIFIAILSAEYAGATCIGNPKNPNKPIELEGDVRPVLAMAMAAPLQLTSTQKLTIQQLTSVFENSSTAFQYPYIEDIGDGAGVTCGRVGFTGEEIGLLVKKYVLQKRGKTPLAKYLPCLEKMGASIEQDYSCLFPSLTSAQMAAKDFKSDGITKTDFGKAWAQAGQDRAMKTIQDKYVEGEYLVPALQEVTKQHLHTPLAAALFYDTVIQMDSIHQIEAYAQTQFGAAHQGRLFPSDDLEEKEWLGYYQSERKNILSKTVSGAGTTPRVDSLNQILNSGNMDLNLPIHITYFGDAFTLTGAR
jgi:chitosanase